MVEKIVTEDDRNRDYVEVIDYEEKNTLSTFSLDSLSSCNRLLRLFQSTSDHKQSPEQF